MKRLSNLVPGTRFRLIEMPEITGILVKASEARALVRLDRPERDVEFTDATGEPRQFRSRGAQTTSWAPTTLVEPVGFEALNHEENDMSKAKKVTKSDTTKASKGEKAAKAKTPKATKSDGKLSCVDAAAKVLADAKAPMTTKELIDQMAAKGLWSSPGGQTPAATLYSAILREIQKKEKDSRFAKAERGKFAINR